jgi:hypothetical protein
MAFGPTQSGRLGKVYKAGSPDTEIEITKWSRQGEVDTDRFATSMSDGHKQSQPGNKAATGTVEGRRRTDGGKIEAILAEGDQVTLKLGFTSTNGISQPCTIKSLSFEVDADSGAMQSFSFTWESNGASSAY